VSDSNSTRTRDESIAFFGTIIAGQSHEVTNVLNIISELAGLQLDLLRVGEQGLPVNLPRLQEVAAKIKDQVNRGETIIRNLNGFAHSVDLPVAVFDLKEAIERALFFAQRSARLARVELVSELPTESIVMESNPFCVQQAVFICIDLALRSASDNRRVVVDYAVRGDGAEIRVTSGDRLSRDQKTEDRLELLQFLLEGIGGSLIEGPGDDPPGIVVFHLPRHANAESKVP
jgi:signal transduction histidine kinase